MIGDLVLLLINTNKYKPKNQKINYFIEIQSHVTDVDTHSIVEFTKRICILSQYNNVLKWNLNLFNCPTEKHKLQSKLEVINCWNKVHPQIYYNLKSFD